MENTGKLAIIQVRKISTFPPFTRVYSDPAQPMNRQMTKLQICLDTPGRLRLNGQRGLTVPA